MMMLIDQRTPHIPIRATLLGLRLEGHSHSMTPVPHDQQYITYCSSLLLLLYWLRAERLSSLSFIIITACVYLQSGPSSTCLS